MVTGWRGRRRGYADRSTGAPATLGLEGGPGVVSRMSMNDWQCVVMYHLGEGDFPHYVRHIWSV